MFVELANLFAPGIVGANAILTGFRPVQVLDLMERYWQAAAPALGAPVADARTTALDLPNFAPAPLQLPLHHIAYAFLLENTKLVEIMRRVVWEYRHGERLPTANAGTMRWLNTTEDLFFAPAGPFSVRSVTSALRPDHDAVRRGIYFRLIGMDLSFPLEGRTYLKADAANQDFAMVFEALIAEFWKGYTNRRNLVGEDATDNNAIMQLVRRLREMLIARRLTATPGLTSNLAREEFDAVAMLSFLYLSVIDNTDVVQSLNATAVGVADRLAKIGERVGIKPDRRADAFFQLARPVSVILRAIEQNAIVAAGGAISLYNGLYTRFMTQIATHWSIARDINIKDPTIRRPLGVLAATASGSRTPSGNGASGIPVNRLAGVLR